MTASCINLSVIPHISKKSVEKYKKTKNFVMIGQYLKKNLHWPYRSAPIRNVPRVSKKSKLQSFTSSRKSQDKSFTGSGNLSGHRWICKSSTLFLAPVYTHSLQQPHSLYRMFTAYEDSCGHPASQLLPVSIPHCSKGRTHCSIKRSTLSRVLSLTAFWALTFVIFKRLLAL